MFTIKCSKHDGTMHVYEASGYTINPPKRNEEGNRVTIVDSWKPDGSGPIPHQVVKEDWGYEAIFIENASGKTIDVIRPSLAE